jgi:hypothetical protein
MAKITKKVSVDIHVGDGMYCGVCQDCRFLISANGDIDDLVEPYCALFYTDIEIVTDSIGLRCNECMETFGGVE